MDCNLYTFFYSSLSRRVSSITVTSVLCISCIFPRPVIGWSESLNNIVTDISENNTNSLKNRFDEIELNIKFSENPFDECRKFLQSFVEEINAKHGLNLTVHEASMLVLENLHNLQAPIETKKIIIDIIAILEDSPNTNIDQIRISDEAIITDNKDFGAYWPWQWNWFGLNKKNHKSKSSKKSSSSSFAASSLFGETNVDKELPSTMYLGGVEVFAGALVFIIGLAFTPAYAIGSALMVDGTRRVFNGLEELDRQRQSNPSSGPFNSNY